MAYDAHTIPAATLLEENDQRWKRFAQRPDLSPPLPGEDLRWQGFAHKFGGPPANETEDQRGLRLASNRRPDLSQAARPGEPLAMPPAPIASAQQSANAQATPSAMPPAGPVFPGTPVPGSL